MAAPPLLFTPIQLRDVTLKNRVVIAPMHQYSAVEGFATDWHLMNAGRYAAGGAGLVIMEFTKVERRGCGTVGDLGIWQDEFIPGPAALRRVHPPARRGAGHPARPFRPQGAPLPPVGRRRAADAVAGDRRLGSLGAGRAERARLARERSDAARADARRNPARGRGLGRRRAARRRSRLRRARDPRRARLPDPPVPLAGREPAQRRIRRQPSANRMRFCIEVVEAVRAHWPAEKPLFLRLSVEDDAGWDRRAQRRARAHRQGPWAST